MKSLGQIKPGLMPALFLINSLLFVLFLFSAIKIWKEKKEVDTPDLRNRIIGARIYKHNTHASPYFYKWKKEDGFEYLDPYDTPDLQMNRNTVTPFTLWILTPFCDMEYNKLSYLWYISEIIAFLLILFVMVLLSVTVENKLLIIAAGLFSVGISQGWTLHNLSGQIYIFIPLLLTFIFLLSQKNSFITEGTCGFILAILILIRPNSAIFVLPFLLLIRWRVILTLFSFLTLYYFFEVGLSSFWVWADYFKAMNLWYFECINPHITSVNFMDHLKIAGMEQPKIMNLPPELVYLEDTSVLNSVSRFLNIHLTKIHLFATLFMPVTFGIVYYLKKIRSFDLNKLFVLAYTFYFISELCIPSYRNSYNSVQWIFPISLLILNQRSDRTISLLIIAGSVFATGILKFFPFDLFMSELLFLGACVVFLTRKKFIPEKAATSLKSGLKLV